MFVSIEDKILEKYPEVQIGFLVAHVTVKKCDPFVEQLKSELANCVAQSGINATNFSVHPAIAIWRKMYEEDFRVKAKTYKSSLESLVRRVVTGKAIWNICNVVDLYNCTSISTMLPMGGYDLSKISGDIKIRYAEEGELFWALGEREKIAASSEHVVYADAKKIICWLWNHKDSAESCIDTDTKQVLFFIDSFDESQAQMALNTLKENLRKIECIPTQEGILNKVTTCIELT